MGRRGEQSRDAGLGDELEDTGEEGEGLDGDYAEDAGEHEGPGEEDGECVEEEGTGAKEEEGRRLGEEDGGGEGKGENGEGEDARYNDESVADEDDSVTAF